jgi:hypothetical protein
MYPLLIVAVVGLVAIVAFTSPGYSTLEWIIFGFFLLVIAVVGFRYFFGVDVIAKIQGVATPKPKIDLTVVSSASAPSAEVFHVPGKYTYSDAQALCRAYGGKLANIDQITSAFEKGADWCDYGWSDENMALFPTQKKTWALFNDGDGGNHGQDCGRPGVNGGYNNNLQQRLGANCYAPKPPQSGPIQPLVVPPKKGDARTQYYTEHPPAVSPFNYTQWNASEL